MKIISPCDVMVSLYCTLKVKDKISMIFSHNNNSSFLNNLLLVNVIKGTGSQFSACSLIKLNFSN